MEFKEFDPLLTPPGPPRRGATKRARVVKTVVVVLATVVVGLVLFFAIPPMFSTDSNSNGNSSDTPVLLASGFPRRWGGAKRFGAKKEFVVAETENGQVRGLGLKSREGRKFFGFWGIPYAEPPLGEMRFQPPRKLKRQWSDVLDASVNRGKQQSCVEKHKSEVSGTEDCLVLHVMTPKVPRGTKAMHRWHRKYPVMFYILGGGFKYGEANRYGGDYMMDQDVVLVLVQFRSGAFGHLSTEDGEIRGNMAYKDQAMALKWVKENIVHFGGDPNQICIFGNSSGAQSVHAFILSPMTRGYFHAAISQSGSIITNPGPIYSSLEVARQLGRDLNCTDVQNTTALHQCLIDADPRAIADVEILDFIPLVAEVIPEDGDMSDVFMSDDPYDTLVSGNFTPVPWILGGNSGESYAIANNILTVPAVVDALNSNWSDVVGNFVNFNDDEDHNAAEALRQTYFGNETVSNTTRMNLVHMISDTTWIHPLKRAADAYARVGGSVYFYTLTHEPVTGYGSDARAGFKPPYGVAHADEVQFLFPYEPNPYIGEDSPDYEFSKMMVRVWADFAKTGKPKIPHGPKWPQINAENPDNSQWMELGDKPKLVDVPDRLKFLDDFPLMYYQSNNSCIIGD